MERKIKLIGFKYLKINSEKNEDFNGDLKLTPGINIRDVKKNEGKEEILTIIFDFSVDFNGLGKIDLLGKMYLAVDSKTLKEAVDGWKAQKMDNEINIIILNIIMQKASIKALELEEEMGLPLHIQLPRLQPGKKE
jgi:hypothetical protein